MKKLLFTALIAVSLISSAFAVPVKEVSYQISNAFASTFPNATNVQWKTTGEYVKASFIRDNIVTEAFYNPNGDLIGTSRAIALDNMPTNIKRSFAKKFSGYTVKESIQFDGTEETVYFISAENDKTSVILKGDQRTFDIVKVTNR